MPHVSTNEHGTVTSVSTQISQEFRPDPITAGNGFTSAWVLTRGAPRIFVHALQTAGAVAATLQVEASVSDDDSGNQLRTLVLSSFLTPLNVPQVIPLQIPSKFCRVVVLAPAANDVEIAVALMAAQ